MLFRLYRKLFARSHKPRRRPIRRNRAVLRCEGLEERWTPAAVNQVGDLLSIDFNSPGEIVNIRQLAGDEYEVYEIDGGLNLLGTFNGVNDIEVNGNGVNNIALSIDGNADDSDSLVGDFTVTQVGGDDFEIFDAAAVGGPGPDFGISGNFTVNNSTSNNFAVRLLNGGHLFGDTIINDAGADADIDLGDIPDEMTFNGFVSLNLGEGNNDATFNAVVVGYVSVIGDAGDDTVELLESHILGDFGVDLGSGYNVVDINASFVDGNVFGFEGEFSEIHITASTVSGFVSFINNGDGDLTATIESDATDGITQIFGFASFISGGGNDQVTISSTPGNDPGEGVYLFDNVGVNLGDGQNAFELMGEPDNHVIANLNVFAYATTGLGPDGRTPAPHFESSGGLQVLVVNYATVGGFVSVVNNSDLYDLGAEIRQSDVNGFFSVISGDTNDLISVEETIISGVIDPYTGVVVSLAYHLGGGNDTVNHRQSSFGGLVEMLTGAGQDTITLNDSPNDSHYLGMIVIDMGDDDDELVFANVGEAVLFAGADIDGGSGTNILDDTSATLLGAATINDVNFV